MIKSLWSQWKLKTIGFLSRRLKALLHFSWVSSKSKASICCLWQCFPQDQCYVTCQEIPGLNIMSATQEMVRGSGKMLSLCHIPLALGRWWYLPTFQGYCCKDDRNIICMKWFKYLKALHKNQVLLFQLLERKQNSMSVEVHFQYMWWKFLGMDTILGDEGDI